MSTLEVVRRGTFTFPHESLSPEARDLISRCLTYDPKDRPSIEQVLQHPWLTGRPTSSPPISHSVPIVRKDLREAFNQGAEQMRVGS